MKNPELLTKRFEKNIPVVLRCFDRLVLFGIYQPIYYPNPMSWQVHLGGNQTGQLKEAIYQQAAFGNDRS